MDEIVNLIKILEEQKEIFKDKDVHVKFLILQMIITLIEYNQTLNKYKE